MEVFSIKTPVISEGDSVFEFFCNSKTKLKEKDIVCVASKIVSYEQGRIEKMLYKDLDNLVRSEADEILREGKWALTVKDGIVTCNAGIDSSNVSPESVVLWPEKIWEWCDQFRVKLIDHFKLKELGVIVTDSVCTPRRRGVRGVALAWSGFVGITDERGKKDLFDNELAVTYRHVADSIADSAVLVMGEGNESTPFAVVRSAPVSFTNEKPDPNLGVISSEEDLFAL
jgi:coenzyme F420-0:L-glutamate ligase